MADARSNFLKTIALKVAAWLRAVASRLETRMQKKDSAAPRASGPPAHWVERVKDAAPELLQPGLPNFQAVEMGDDGTRKPEAKPVAGVISSRPTRKSRAAVKRSTSVVRTA